MDVTLSELQIKILQTMFNHKAKDGVRLQPITGTALEEKLGLAVKKEPVVVVDTPYVPDEDLHNAIFIACDTGDTSKPKADDTAEEHHNDIFVACDTGEASVKPKEEEPPETPFMKELKGLVNEGLVSYTEGRDRMDYFGPLYTAKDDFFISPGSKKNISDHLRKIGVKL